MGRASNATPVSSTTGTQASRNAWVNALLQNALKTAYGRYGAEPIVPPTVMPHDRLVMM